MTDKSPSTPEYEGWAIIEIMGHTKAVGQIKEVSMAGTVLLKVNIPDPENGETLLTQYYGGSSIFSVTPCDKETAMKMIERQYWNLSEPVRLALKEREKDAQEVNFLPSPEQDDE